ncbi:MAG: Crp/Fnr family transcriptional regulator [Bacteroidota bacterium]
MNDLDKLYRFIENHVSLSEDIKERLSGEIKHIHFKKGDKVVELGRTSSTLYFVVSGIYRVYKLHEGKEITGYFNVKDRNPFVASFVSLLTQTPSKEIVECIQDGELLSISYAKWKQFYQISESLNTFGRITAEYNYVLAIERIEALQYQSAADRYNAFLKIYPNLINQIPHHYIASYIGITPESLSRLRKSLTKSDS